ncbi:hypothetical protein MRB53_010409 [Persea americana]|uniref:Uncharacterized protein n=1 Tax=Persea americana TaxID=3435 RepID=A0ACC2LRV9_PERAE|nr:hypothetical protein MRB53_010409 [Persea americana]
MNRCWQLVPTKDRYHTTLQTGSAQLLGADPAVPIHNYIEIRPERFGPGLHLRAWKIACRNADLPLLPALSTLLLFQRSKTQNTTASWRTLTGNAPVVIAKGGFSGFFLIPVILLTHWQC